MKLERQLDGVNQVAVLMHNDCFYLSQEILGLAFEVSMYYISANLFVLMLVFLSSSLSFSCVML
jgi:hypothetical protein